MTGIKIAGTYVTRATVKTLVEAFPYDAIRPELGGDAQWENAVMRTEEQCLCVRRVVQQYCATRPQGSHQWKAALTAALQP